MNYKNKKLQIKQVDKELRKFKSGIIDKPSKGWINTIRVTLGISLEQLSKRLKISPQSISSLEKREVDMNITLGKLNEIAESMGFKLVYGFVSESSIEEMIKNKSYELAKKIVMSTSEQMSLENQKVENKRILEAIEERTNEIIRTMPKMLWD